MLCENELFLRILYFFNTAMNILRFVIPIILIIRMVLEIYHQVININDDSAKEKISKRIFASIVIFLVPTIINVFLGFMETISGYTFNYSECNYNANPKNINDLIAEREGKQKEEEDLKSDEYKQKYYNNRSSQTLYTTTNKTTSDDSTSTMIGRKFEVSDDELNDIAKVCQAEQGSPEGSGIEAELMVNKYILSGSTKSLYDYLFKEASGWWSPIRDHKYPSVKLNPENREAVRKVIVEGIRQWPGYINEHDCFNCADTSRAHAYCSNGNRGDICYLTLNNQKISEMSKISSRSDEYYVRNQTVIQNKSGATYTFYGFVKENGVNIGDPFGYTAEAKEKYDSLNK